MGVKVAAPLAKAAAALGLAASFDDSRNLVLTLVANPAKSRSQPLDCRMSLEQCIETVLKPVKAHLEAA